MCALLIALAALVAPVLASPASASAAPAAVDEYDLAIPQDDGPQDPAPIDPAPDPAPEPAPPAPADPTLPAGPTETVPAESIEAPTAPRRALDRAAARRDVLFEVPAQAAAPVADTLAAPAQGSSRPPALWLVFGLGGACIVVTLVRLRRFATALAASPRAVPRSQS